MNQHKWAYMLQLFLCKFDCSISIRKMPEWQRTLDTSWYYLLQYEFLTFPNHEVTDGLSIAWSTSAGALLVAALAISLDPPRRSTCWIMERHGAYRHIVAYRLRDREKQQNRKHAICWNDVLHSVNSTFCTICSQKILHTFQKTSVVNLRDAVRRHHSGRMPKLSGHPATLSCKWIDVDDWMTWIDLLRPQERRNKK